MVFCRAAFPLFCAILAAQGPVSAEAFIDHKHKVQHPSQQQLETAHEADAQLLQEAQPVSSTTTESTSWFQRMGNAIIGVLSAIFIVIPFSIALLWVNERRSAQLETLISLGQSEAETLEAAQKDLSDYDGTLVHLNYDSAKGMDAMADERFPSVKMESGCLKLMSYVEVYQWVEEVKETTQKNSVGGGETKKKTYSYKQEWTDHVVNSSGFHDKSGHSNTVSVNGLTPGLETKVNGTVKYGEVYHLPKQLVEQIGKYEDASKLAGGDLKFNSCTFQKDGDYFYYPPKQGSPKIGDSRVKLQYAPDTAASILALQVKDKTQEGGRTLAPYRTVPRGFCGGLTDDELKKRRIDQSKKDGDDLYEEEKCLDFGPFACLCCCCNLVTYCFSKLSTSSATSNSNQGESFSSVTVSLTPEIYSAWTGKLGLKQCFASVKSAASMTKWVIRLVGWLLLWGGFSALFEPLEVAFDILPFLGPYIGSGLAAVTGFFTFLLTVLLATLLVSLAYCIYHPLVGVLYLAVTGGMVYGIIFAANMLGAKSKTA